LRHALARRTDQRLRADLHGHPAGRLDARLPRTGGLATSGHLAVLGADWAVAGLLVYNTSRFAVAVAVAALAFASAVQYGTWIYLYALSEAVLYVGTSARLLTLVLRRERKQSAAMGSHD
jgi:hypothetical protein